MSDLTREGAIKILKDTLYDEKTPTDYLKAVKMGREALENQKSVIEELEDIKAEIGNPKTCLFAGTYEADWIMEQIIDKRISELRDL